MIPDNQTTGTEFILLPFSSGIHIQYILGFLFLLIYFLTLAGNLLIMAVIKMDSQLHTPMYFFLVNLSFLDIFCSSVIAPKLVYTLLTKNKTVSLNGCLVQIGLMFFIASSEAFILSVMAYDRYSAICNPLVYVMVMSKQFCTFLACGSCLLGVINSLMNTLPLLRLHFCGPHLIYHYSCEMPELLPLSCIDFFPNKMILFTTLVVFGFGCFFLILFSYTRIISAILKISSASGKSKAFSTCSSHIIVVTLFFMTGMGRYLSPATGSILEQVISLQYTIVTPLLNPMIYCLKNVEVKIAIKKMWGKKSILSGTY